MTALFLLSLTYAFARTGDAFAAYRRRTDPWRAQA